MYLSWVFCIWLWLSCLLTCSKIFCVSVMWDFPSDSLLSSAKCSPASIPFISPRTPSFIKRQPTDWDKRPSRKRDSEAAQPAALKASASNRPSNLGRYQRYQALGPATCACVCERDLAKEQAPLYTSICEYVHEYAGLCVCVSVQDWHGISVWFSQIICGAGGIRAD